MVWFSGRTAARCMTRRPRWRLAEGPAAQGRPGRDQDQGHLFQSGLRARQHVHADADAGERPEAQAGGHAAHLQRAPSVRGQRLTAESIF